MESNAEKAEEATNFFDIPVEVFDANVLPHLQWNDLLRFRRVCRWTGAMAYDFMRLHSELAPEIEINEDDKSFGDFMKMSIPTTARIRIFINNASGAKFYENAGESGFNFLQENGPLVEHLRVKQMSSLLHGNQLAFLEGLKNLRTFELDNFGDGTQEEINESPAIMPVPGSKPIPLIFKQLKEVKMRNREDQVWSSASILTYTRKLLKTCSNLEYIAPPFSEYHYSGVFILSMANTFSTLQKSLNNRWNHCKTIDFKNFHSIGQDNYEAQLIMGSANFWELCAVCLKDNVKLLNVGSSWFFNWHVTIQDPQPDLGIPVYSLVNLHPSALIMTMPKLERIEIKSSAISYPGPNRICPDWPSLKILDVTMDSTDCKYVGQQNHEFVKLGSVQSISDLLFRDGTREALTELRLNFVKDGSQVLYPKTAHIVASCPNLKKLTLINWPDTSASLTKLWKGLPKLEEVCLENCTKLGNDAFLGSIWTWSWFGSPVFLKLTNLKKLSLKGLDQMPKITDTLFSQVNRHLPLTHLNLTSSAPLTSVTLAGINSLLDGKFAESVEKFSFNGWSMKDISSEDMAHLQSKFHSSSVL